VTDAGCCNICRRVKSALFQRKFKHARGAQMALIWMSSKMRTSPVTNWVGGLLKISRQMLAARRGLLVAPEMPAELTCFLLHSRANSPQCRTGAQQSDAPLCKPN
jgi:hypothetical protein